MEGTDRDLSSVQNVSAWVKIITIRKEKLNLLNDIKVKKLRKRESVIDTSVKQQIMIGHSLLCKVNELKKTKIKE